MKRGFKTQAEKKAIEIRKELGLYASSPLAGETLAKHLGMEIRTPHQINGLTELDFSLLLRTERSAWSAFSLKANGKVYIVHNPIHSKARTQSNLMHEISHILCGHEKETITPFGGCMFRDFNKGQEEEAEWLGGCLQLPRPALLWAVRRGMKNPEIAIYFNASEEMVRFRRNKSGVDRQLFARRR